LLVASTFIWNSGKGGKGKNGGSVSSNRGGKKDDPGKKNFFLIRNGGKKEKKKKKGRDPKVEVPGEASPFSEMRK